MKKKLFELDKNLIPNVEKIYYNNSFIDCSHKVIGLDVRDNIWKCTVCFYFFDFDNKRQYKAFMHRMSKDYYDFEQMEKDYSKKVVKEEEREEMDHFLKELYMMY
ncbi:hypothetical protein SCHIN_v1c12180 [Spiroplasma chinense]|uniref:Uncharacterized protein n=1 Tax=Spiroplasma chinense TaxID=216932 RepID=A0A5B9Y5U1_9MOLU|nr:hypothetical protein [Spiroplasma chinense]QEH62411.1 hypothetical protein SCHIN_v1c12180 [Spiroplasma chinense]